MIQQHKQDAQKSALFRYEMNKWIQDNKTRGCSQFAKEVNRLEEICRLLLEGRYYEINCKYQIDQQGYLELRCKHPNPKNSWIHPSCLLPFKTKIQDCMRKETCKEILTRTQHSNAPVNEFSWSKPKTQISPKISVINGNFQNRLDNYTTVSGRQVTLEDGSLYTGKIYFFGDRIHSTRQPQKLKEFPRLQTMQQSLISCSMISAVLKDEKGNDLYTKYPFKLIEEVPEMIDNQTARQFKKFVFDPIDGAWIQKNGLSFNEAKRTFEYEVDTIDSLGPSYITKLIQRLANPIQANFRAQASKNPLKTQQQELKRQIMIENCYQDYENDDRETYFPSCLRSNYVPPSDQQPRKLYIFPFRLSYIQIQGKRFYFVPKGYQYNLININQLYKLWQQSTYNSIEYNVYAKLIEIKKQDISTCYQEIKEHNMENKSEAESAGQLIIDLENFTFTRKDISSQTFISAYQFKDLDEEKRKEEKAKKEAEIISQNNIIQFEESISNKISNDLDGTTDQQKLFEKLALQTVYLSEGQYQNQLIKFLRKQKSQQIYNRDILEQQKYRPRLLKHLSAMSGKMGQEQFNCQKMLFDDLSACRSHIYEKIYTKKLKAQLINDVRLNAKGQMLQMEKLLQETKTCIVYMEKIKGLRGKGGLDFQELLKQLGPLGSQYIAAIQKNTELSLNNINQLSPNSSSSAIDNNPMIANQFTKTKAILQNRSQSLNQFFNKLKNFKLNDHQYKKQTPIIFKIKIDINDSANYLISQAVKEIIASRINNDQAEINRRIDEAINGSEIPKQLKKWNLTPALFQPHKQVFLNSSRSKLGSDKFGKQCEQYLKRSLKQFKISQTESQEQNISRLQQKINMMKNSFKSEPGYKVKQQDHIWNYSPEFNNLMELYRGFTQLYCNVDSLSNAISQLKPSNQPELSPPYSSHPKPKNSEVSQLKGMYLDKFLIDSMGHILQNIASAIQQPIKQIRRDIGESQEEIAQLDGQFKFKARQQELLENQWLQKLIEERKELQIYGKAKGQLRPLSIPNLRKLEEDERKKVEQNFQSSILPSLEGGDVVLNCQNEIKKIRTKSEKDEQLYSKANVDRTFHQDKVKELEKHIQRLQQWIDTSKKIKRQYASLQSEYNSLKYLQQKYGQQHENSQQFVKEVKGKNVQIQNLFGRMKSYNERAFGHLKSSQQIDEYLLQIDYNKIKISHSSKEIEGIYDELSRQTEQWKKVFAKRGRNPAEFSEVARNLQKSFSKLDALQLRSAGSNNAQFTSFIDQFKKVIEQIKAGRELNRRQETDFKRNFQKLKGRVYELKDINKFIDP